MCQPLHGPSHVDKGVSTRKRLTDRRAGRVHGVLQATVLQQLLDLGDLLGDGDASRANLYPGQRVRISRSNIGQGNLCQGTLVYKITPGLQLEGRA